MKLIVYILLSFIVSFESLSGQGGIPKTGVTSNAVTGKPLADAYVVKTWEACFGIAHCSTSCYKARYAVTKSSGKYRLSVTFDHPDILGPHDSKSYIFVYKPGYISPTYGSEYYDQEDKDNLVPFTGNAEERLEYLDDLSGDLYCRYEDKKILPVYKAIYQEMRGLLSGSPNNKLANYLCHRIANIETENKNAKYNPRRKSLQSAEYINEHYPECLENEHFRAAILHKNLELGESILRNGLDPNSRYMRRSLYTHILKSPSLTWEERTAFLVLLTEYGGNPYLRDRDRERGLGWSPIRWLSYRAENNNNNEGPLAIAALTALLSTSKQNAYYESLPPALEYAALSRRLDVIKAYIDAGHDINKPTRNGNSLLTYAVSTRSDSTDVIEYLLANGADVNYRSPTMNQETLIYAVIANNFTIVSFLIENGANVNAVDRLGRTALHLAIGGGVRDSIAKRLIESGADVNATDRYGRTALHIAADYPNLEIAQYLIEAGADKTITDNDGRDARSRSSIRSGTNKEKRSLFIEILNGNR